EADEMVIGRLDRDVQKNRKATITGISGRGQTAVLGRWRRLAGGKAGHVKPVAPYVLRKPLLKKFGQYVAPGSHVYTHKWAVYKSLTPDYGYELVRCSGGLSALRYRRIPRLEVPNEMEAFRNLESFGRRILAVPKREVSALAARRYAKKK